jgi:hypothetical protein
VDDQKMKSASASRPINWRYLEKSSMYYVQSWCILWLHVSVVPGKGGGSSEWTVLQAVASDLLHIGYLNFFEF